MAIVNALAFYNDMHMTLTGRVEKHGRVLMDDDQEQWRLAFKEDNRGNDWQGPVDQLATNRAMAICALVVLMTVGCIPAVILETIDDIRRFRQKTRDAASWRNGTSQ